MEQIETIENIFEEMRENIYKEEKELIDPGLCSHMNYSRVYKQEVPKNILPLLIDKGIVHKGNDCMYSATCADCGTDPSITKEVYESFNKLYIK